MSTSEIASLLVASVALALSFAQWLHSRRVERLKLLLGDKEAVGYEAIRIWRHPRAYVNPDLVHTLILVALFERSDRARMQVYRALDALKPRHGKAMVAMRNDLAAAAERYPESTNPESFRRRLEQLDRALPWIRVSPAPDPGPVPGRHLRPRRRSEPDDHARASGHP